MAKERFSRQQNDALKNASTLEEKFELLNEWKENGEISVTLFNEKTNELINKAMRKVKPASVDFSDNGMYKTVIEGEIQTFINQLRNRINKYLSHRDKHSAQLEEKDIENYQRYLEKYGYLRSKINRLLIVGLRYPDYRLNQISEEYIKKNKMFPETRWADSAFWLLLWEDGNLVPINAVRLMIVDNGKGEFELNPCFNKHLILELMPLVEFQRDKEKIRLEWAKKLRNTEQRKAEVERKQKRLDFFNCLLEVMKKI